MTIITIPEKLAEKGELVLIPRDEYEILLKRQRIVPVVDLSLSEKRALARGRKEMAKGDYVTLEQLEHGLGGTHRKKR